MERNKRERLISKLRDAACAGKGLFLDPGEIEDLLNAITVGALIRWLYDRRSGVRTPIPEITRKEVASERSRG